MGRDNILTFAVLCVFHAWTFSVDSTVVYPRLNRRNPSAITLDMALDSIDDEFKGCRENMLHKVYEEILTKELEDFFLKIWWENVLELFTITANDLLSKEHIIAIKMYTRFISKRFNEDTRTQRKKYGNEYKFHSVFFLLADAVRILHEPNMCVEVFRRSEGSYIGTSGTKMRFGQFTSSSKSAKQSERFGKSCFEINTCFGASIKEYSTVPEEEEVLIPPYEVFEIIQVTKNENPKHNECLVTYKLKSTETTKSFLNCHIVNPDKK